jgi:CBS domain-containing protein
MTLMTLLTPLANVAWMSISDTVRDAYDHLESHDLTAAPLLDWSGRYVGTVTEADLRRHVAGKSDRALAFATPLGQLERRAHNPAVVFDQGLGTLAMRACSCGFVPVVDRTNKLIGIIDRRRLTDLRFPTAA